MNIFEISASATAGVLTTLLAFFLVLAVAYKLYDLAEWWWKQLTTYKLIEKNKRPPYDELVITEIANNGDVLVEMVRDGKVVWRGKEKISDKSDAKVKTVRRFTC